MYPCWSDVFVCVMKWLRCNYNIKLCISLHISSRFWLWDTKCAFGEGCGQRFWLLLSLLTALQGPRLNVRATFALCFDAEIVCMRLFNSVLSGYTECYWTICVSAAWRLGLMCVCYICLLQWRWILIWKKKPSCNTSFTTKQKLQRKWRFEHFLQMYFALNVNALHCLFNHTHTYF